MMDGNCIDIGTIQAFLDGELANDVSARVTNHIADCGDCSFLLAEAEEESAFVFPVLEREMNTLVPTQRLWARINDSITVEKENTPFWRKVWALVAASIANPSIAVAASVLIVFGIFAAVWNVGLNKVNDPVDPGRSVAVNSQGSSIPAAVLPSVTSVTPPAKAETADRFQNSPKNPQFVAVKANYTKSNEPEPVVKANVDPSRTVDSSGYIPGEESYVKTINNLSQSVAGQKDTAMRPSQRVSYERDLAVVDDSISKMRKEVRKNPKNESAKQVLYNSYQNKIDLLNSVAQKEELVASLK